VAAARDRGLPIGAGPDEFVNDPGTGVVGVVDGVEVSVSRAGSVAGLDLQAPTRQTAVQVTWGGQPRGVITLADQVKPGAAAAIAELKAMGITPMLLTGDSMDVAEQVAAAVGIEPADVIAGVLPTGKSDVITQLQAQGRTVAMVGDGVNDSVALAVADIGMAMGSGADVAIDAGDLTLMRADVRTVPTALRLSARTLRTIRINLFWAFAYNAAAIPLAAAGLLNPMISGAAMACSSLLVVTNSLRLKRFKDD
jgi:Cu+-exporting ATPase